MKGLFRADGDDKHGDNDAIAVVAAKKTKAFFCIFFDTYLSVLYIRHSFPDPFYIPRCWHFTRHGQDA